MLFYININDNILNVISHYYKIDYFLGKYMILLQTFTFIITPKPYDSLNQYHRDSQKESI
ncbi:hypothetical protein DID76_02710 [Candidatus Marinamargulisbacteria bacterium SCGC AG-414-C22]|nr:hypothetical protein DID76_02710 [Candidatus Marinamargulisbacteria bacterium SCGC AG-414-C22]